jgi:hypothetical protein
VGKPIVRVDTSRPGIVDVTVENAGEDDTFDLEVDVRGRGRRPIRLSWLERLRSALFDG